MSRPKSSYTLWILGHAVRALFALLIIFVCAFLIWRVAFSQKPPKELRLLSANEALCAAYETHDGKLTVLEQPSQIDYSEDAKGNQAYFRYDWCLFVEQAEQVQVLFFYNNSTLEKVAEEHELGKELPRGEEVFDVVLTQYIDRTSDEDETEAEVKEILPGSCEVGTNRNGMYTFLRYTFDGVNLTDTVTIYLDVFYEGIEGSLGTLRLYHHENHSEVRALTRKEEKIVRGE